VIFPHRRKYLLLIAEFLRGLLEMHQELVDDARRELAPATRRHRRGRHI
jgi:hypothetical protein